MRLLLINAVCGYGSTGRIVLDIAKEYEQNGYEVKIAYGRNGECPEEAKKYAIRIGSDMDVYWHVLYTRLTDKHGLASKLATNKFLKWADEYNPDVLWLHNIHGYYINYEMLFDWIKGRPQMQVRWTLHDCWTFTGHCSHFLYIKCDKWRRECCNCLQLDQYPKSIVDNSSENYLRKKNAFTGVNNLKIITPSKWLKNNVHKSFLCEYESEVIYNKVNLNEFRPISSNFKEEHGIMKKKMLLGVANVWNDRKGLGDFIKLSKLLDSSYYQIVLVGLTRKQINDLKKKQINILGMERTTDLNSLIKIYTAADVFLNLSYEDTFPTVNLEAEACGTRVISYDSGGCAETLSLPESIVIEADLTEILNYI